MITGYSDYPGFGWVMYGRLVINYAHGRTTSVFFNGALMWERKEDRS